MSGNAAGTQATWRDADGKVHVFFKFNDRGRGPKIWTEITSGADGIPTSLVNTGVDYLKGPVEERFGIAGGKASWKLVGAAYRAGIPARCCAPPRWARRGS